MGLKRLLQDLVGLRPTRMQVAALCLRGEGAVREVLLVTSRGTGRWILPKGWPIPGRDLAGSALQEAWEEAGVQGKASKRPVGRYADIKHNAQGLGLPVRVLVFQVDDVRLADDFPEKGQRERRWVALGEAADLVNDGGLADLLRGL